MKKQKQKQNNHKSSIFLAALIISIAFVGYQQTEQNRWEEYLYESQILIQEVIPIIEPEPETENTIVDFKVNTSPTTTNTEIVRSVVTTFEVNGLEGLSAGLRSVVSTVDSSVLAIMNNELNAWGSAVVYQKHETSPYTYYAITNYHVVENLTGTGSVSKVNVYFDEFTFIEANVLGYDARTDIAVISFTTNKNLFVPAIGDVNNLERGEIVIAMGSPLSSHYFNTATMGIVGGSARYIINSAESLNVRVIQHDAAINPGNSGGPLFNLKNQLIGINFAKKSRSSFSSASLEGMGFAISIDVAAQVANQIIEFGNVRRATLGLIVGDVRANIDIHLSSGVYVSEVVLGGVSYGYLQPNDVIISINETSVSSPAQLSSYLLFKQPGEVVTITFIRNDITQNITISLGGS